MIQTAFAVGRSVAPLPYRGTDTASAPPSKCAVFPPGARNYQQFVARRRAQRPIEEYREPTTEELKEFGDTLAGGRSNSVAAYARTERAAPTNTHVCVVVSYKLTHLKPTGSPLSRRTSTPGSRPPANKSGSATLNNCSSH
jgi:hypothetical protein